ncbi:hypothetical protein [Streptomyces sp. 2A115]|uniref:hypothetical protein n=1 Tax=Streptomyces sp. 2A115 TaxID=3457439 RepID=UPI003FCF5B82
MTEDFNVGGAVEQPPRASVVAVALGEVIEGHDAIETSLAEATLEVAVVLRCD